MTDEGLCRVGWSTANASLDLGTDQWGYGYGGTGKKSFNKQFDAFGEVKAKNSFDCVMEILARAMVVSLFVVDVVLTSSELAGIR